ncbi:MAG: glutamate-5-semialdehyde dehydrogenase [Candidatus Omnitrophica bacterium]|nr:glutamate-5-semialdehyde dehydrogenase [Candidatus Omnitrophota bacterium]
MKELSQEWQQKLSRALFKAREAAGTAARQTPHRKKTLLLDIARRIEREKQRILRENHKDLVRAQEAGLTSPMIDRLTLDPKRLDAVAHGVSAVAALKDPIGVVQAKWTRPNGLRIRKVTVPLGVILMIYESRPNVTVECAALCLKSSNVAILRGGREAMATNRVFAAIFKEALCQHGLSSFHVNLVTTTDYLAVDFLLRQEGKIDLVIPRGGEKLIRRVVAQSRIPVIKHYQGICHVYVDKKADLKKAVAITVNAKLQRPGVCNAAETLLVHEAVAAKFLPAVGDPLGAGECEVRGDAATRRYLPWAKPATADDYGREFLGKVLAVKVVKNIQEAVRHIETYGSHHTDAIVTDDLAAAALFKSQVDSSSVMVNVSTRFSDGFEYGFGAEIGISTDKIHARGPMGLEGLTSYKYIVEGNGQIRT